MDDYYYFFVEIVHTNNKSTAKTSGYFFSQRENRSFVFQALIHLKHDAPAWRAANVNVYHTKIRIRLSKL